LASLLWILNLAPPHCCRWPGGAKTSLGREYCATRQRQLPTGGCPEGDGGETH